MRRSLTIITFGIALACVDIASAAADPLITEAEAALPSPPEAGLSMRGITRGPAIELEAPAPEAKHLTSPLPLKINFVARNNATIDKDSVKITYVKTPTVDLTTRLKAHLTSDGINMKQAEIPPGNHVIRVDVKDSQGRTSTALFKLSVERK